MNIQIQKPINEYPKQKWELLLMFLERPALIVCLLFFLLLLVCETYYENKISKEPDTIYIGGFYSFIGLFLLIGVVVDTYKTRRKHQKQTLPQTEAYYVMLNDDGYERGVKNLWSEKKSWGLLTGFDERANSFWLRFGQISIPVFKYEFKQPTEIDEFRDFLKKTVIRG